MVNEDQDRMERDEITVVIPVKDREKLIVRCLDSVKEQSWRPLRVVVVDNGSRDKSRQAVAEWAAANSGDGLSLTLVDESRPGAAVARNRGLREVTSEYMLFFDSDDEMKPDLVSTVMRTFLDNPRLDMVYWRTETLFADGRRKTTRFTVDNIWRYQLYHSLLATQRYAVRTSFFRASGCWNEALGGWDDWELGIRLLLNNPVMKGIDDVLAVIYPQRESITGENFHTKAGEWELAIDTAERDVRASDYRDKGWLIDMLNYCRVILAAHYRREGCSGLADSLLRATLERDDVSASDRIMLRLIYRYTSAGGRGAALLWR